MESISCGTPMLAANAQGFAMYLTHGVNAIQLQSRQQAAFQISGPGEEHWSRLMDTRNTIHYIGDGVFLSFTITL